MRIEAGGCDPCGTAGPWPRLAPYAGSPEDARESAAELELALEPGGVLAEVNLTGVPRCWMETLFVAALEDLRWWVASAVEPAELLADPALQPELLAVCSPQTPHQLNPQ